MSSIASTTDAVTIATQRAFLMAQAHNRGDSAAVGRFATAADTTITEAWERSLARTAAREEVIAVLRKRVLLMRQANARQDVQRVVDMATAPDLEITKQWDELAARGAARAKEATAVAVGSPEVSPEDTDDERWRFGETHDLAIASTNADDEAGISAFTVTEDDGEPELRLEWGGGYGTQVPFSRIPELNEAFGNFTNEVMRRHLEVANPEDNALARPGAPLAFRFEHHTATDGDGAEVESWEEATLSFSATAGTLSIHNNCESGTFVVDPYLEDTVMTTAAARLYIAELMQAVKEAERKNGTVPATTRENAAVTAPSTIQQAALNHLRLVKSNHEKQAEEDRRYISLAGEYDLSPTQIAEASGIAIEQVNVILGGRI